MTCAQFYEDIQGVSEKADTLVLSISSVILPAVSWDKHLKTAVRWRFVDPWLELRRMFAALTWPRAEVCIFFGTAPRRSAPDTLRRQPHIEEVREQIELDNRVGIIRFIVGRLFGNP